MTTEVFSFTHTEHELGELFIDASVQGNGGVAVTVDELGSAYGLYSARIAIIVGDGTPKTFAQWLTFLRAVRGAYDTFLYKDPATEALYKVTDSNIGTGTGSTANYPLVHSCIDAATVVVKVNGVATGSYTLLTNFTTPIIQINAGLGLAVTITYEFYYPVRFKTTPRAGKWQFGTYLVESIDIVEDYEEAHRVAA